MKNRIHNPQTTNTRINQAQDDNALERIAKIIVPPSTEVTDDDLKNPGGMTPDSSSIEDNS